MAPAVKPGKFRYIASTKHAAATTPQQQQQYQQYEQQPAHFDEMQSKQRPNFALDLRHMQVGEGETLHLEARLTPADDANIRVEWLKDDRPLQNGESSTADRTMAQGRASARCTTLAT